MMFFLHLPSEATNLSGSPELTQATCEFVLQVVFQCMCPAVRQALIVKRDVNREDWNKTFGAATKRWQQLGKDRGIK
jgi:hypothetical protein